MSSDPTPRRRSRALEVLEEQNSVAVDPNLTEEEIDNISELILRLGDIPKRIRD